MKLNNGTIVSSVLRERRGKRKSWNGRPPPSNKINKEIIRGNPWWIAALKPSQETIIKRGGSVENTEEPKKQLNKYAIRSSRY